jgi:hypothetical protein
MRYLIKSPKVLMIAVTWLTLMTGLIQGANADAGNACLSDPGSSTAVAEQHNYQAVCPTLTGGAVAAAAPVYHRNYAGFEFRPSHSALTFAPYSDGIYATAGAAGEQYFKKALDLPDGARIKRIDLYVIDNSSMYNMTVQLVGFTPASGAQDAISVFTTAGLPVGLDIQTVSLTGNPIVTIDNSENRYYFRYQPAISGDAHVLIGAHVEYTLPVINLPSVVIH